MNRNHNNDNRIDLAGYDDDDDEGFQAKRKKRARTKVDHRLNTTT